MVITDPVKLKKFLALYKQSTYIGTDHGWVKGSSIEIDFIDVIKKIIKQGKTVDDAYALANAYVLQKYDTGIAMSKKDSDGSFKPIFVKETQDSSNPDATNYEQTPDCNL